MYIYIILKILVEFIVQYLNIKIKNLFIFFEISIILLYLYVLYMYHLFNKYLFILGLIWIIIFLSFKIINYLFLNKEQLFKRINNLLNKKKQEKIKNFFLKPKVNKIIYYGIWMLPWNIGYWIYFWIMENGWYARVWISSTRDIILWKVFKWDSRMFFYNLFEKINENKIIKIIFEIKEEIIKAILRLLFIISWIREQMKKKKIIEYIIWRILVFCYLSLFYLYIIKEIQIINKWIIIVIISIEILLLLFIGKILENLLKKDKEYIYIQILIKFIEIENIYLLIDPLNYYFSLKYIKRFFETNNMIWNKILGDSVSLNILYEYIIYVNKNTKGYYFYNCNILTRIKINKINNVSNIPWDILPRTRYVIFNLKYIQYNLNLKYTITINNLKINTQSYSKKLNMLDYRLKIKKNFYLSLFEKTYSEVSVLIIMYILRLNLELNYEFFRNAYYGIILKNNINLKEFEAGLSIFYSNNKPIIIKLLLAKMSKENPNLLNAAYFLHTLTWKERIYDMEGYFMVELLTNSLNNKLSPISTKICSIKQYKKGFQIISKLSLFEEEGMVWQKDIMQFFYLIEQIKLNENVKLQSIKNLEYVLDLLKNHDKSYIQRWYSYDDSIWDIKEGFKIKFLNNFDIENLETFDLYYLLFENNIIIESIGHEYTYEFILLIYNDFLHDLEELEL